MTFSVDELLQHSGRHLMTKCTIQAGPVFYEKGPVFTEFSGQDILQLLISDGSLEISAECLYFQGQGAI